MQAPIRVVLTATVLFWGAAARADDGANPTPAAQPNAVVGVAMIEPNSDVATMRWTYERDGRTVETTVAPKMIVTRLSSDVPLMMVKLPSELFAIKIGEDLQRILEDPLLVDSAGTTTCSCRMRPDCGKGRTFRCEVEAWKYEAGKPGDGSAKE